MCPLLKNELWANVTSADKAHAILMEQIIETKAFTLRLETEIPRTTNTQPS